MDAKHSPGPWEAVVEHEELDGIRHDLCPLVRDGKGRCIVELWSSTQTITNVSQAEQEANAHLISAAPDMKTWGEDALVCLVEYQAYSESMRAIGRGFHPSGKTGHSVEAVISGLASAIRKAEGDGATAAHSRR